VLRYYSGGISGLGITINEYYSSLEADFLRYYNIDLSEALYGDNPISGRRILNLWKSLPEDSAISRKVDPRGAFQTRWTTTDHMLAFLSEQIDILSSMFYDVNAGKSKKKWKSVRHERPELPFEYQPKPKTKRSANTNEIKAILKGNI